MQKRIGVLATIMFAGCCVAQATPLTVDPSTLDRLMSGYHVEYRTIGALKFPGEDFGVYAGELAGIQATSYHLGTVVEWTADGGQHNYVATVFSLGDPDGLDGLVWLTDQFTGMMTAEGYGAYITFPVAPTNLLAASDLVVNQLDNVDLSGPDGPHFGTVLVMTRGSMGGDPLPAPWPSLVPEPSTWALLMMGAAVLLAFRRRNSKAAQPNSVTSAF